MILSKVLKIILNILEASDQLSNTQDIVISDDTATNVDNTVEADVPEHTSVDVSSITEGIIDDTINVVKVTQILYFQARRVPGMETQRELRNALAGENL